MMDCIRDRRGNTGKANFANAAGAKRIQLVIRVVEKGNVDMRAVGVYGYDIVPEVAIDRSATAFIVLRRLQHRHANPHHYRALDLVASGTRINYAPAIDYRDDAANA